MDLGAISTILSSIKTATDLAMLISKSGATLEKAEVKLKFAELIGALAEAKIDVASIQQALLEKDNEIVELKNQLSVKEKLQWEHPYYWFVESGKKDGPYCQQCYDNEHKLIHLNSNARGHWTCKTCRSSYYDKDYHTHLNNRQDNKGYNPFDF